MPIDTAITAEPARGEVLYRLVSGDRPRVEDFMSHRDRPRRRPVPAGTPWLLVVGVSMFDTRARALEVARRRPAWVAELHLAPRRGIHRALTGSAGHHTVWGDPRALEACVRVCDMAP